MWFKKTSCEAITMEQARRELEQDASITVIDVRTREEYAGGHLPQSRNIPLDAAQSLPRTVADRDARLFVYCLSGARSRAACAQFRKLGYTDVTDIGGISAWNGPLVRE